MRFFPFSEASSKKTVYNNFYIVDDTSICVRKIYMKTARNSMTRVNIFREFFMVHEDSEGGY